MIFSNPFDLLNILSKYLHSLCNKITISYILFCFRFIVIQVKAQFTWFCFLFLFSYEVSTYSVEEITENCFFLFSAFKWRREDFTCLLFNLCSKCIMKHFVGWVVSNLLYTVRYYQSFLLGMMNNDDNEKLTRDKMFWNLYSGIAWCSDNVLRNWLFFVCLFALEIAVKCFVRYFCN